MTRAFSLLNGVDPRLGEVFVSTRSVSDDLRPKSNETSRAKNGVLGVDRSGVWDSSKAAKIIDKIA